MTPAQLDDLARRTGLPASTCASLMRAGWRYIEELNKPARFVSPMASLKRRTIVLPETPKEKP